MTAFMDGREGLYAVCVQPPDGTFRTAAVVPAADVESTVAGYAEGCNVWVSAQPVVGVTTGRGTADNVAALSVLYCDLDVKPGGMPDYDSAYAVISDLSKMLGSRPAFIVSTGHGLQPYWHVTEGEFDKAADRAKGQEILRRFGRLVQAVAGQHGGHADSVFDLPRVLRAPGTQNVKGDPIPVTITGDDGWPLSVSEVVSALDAHGFAAQPTDSQQRQPGKPVDVSAALAGLPSIDAACSYGAKALDGILAEPLDDGRHPWLVKSYVRVIELSRAGCIDAAKALPAVTQRFSEAVGDERDVVGEVGSALAWALAPSSDVTPCSHRDEWLAPEPFVMSSPPLDLAGCPKVFRRMVEATAAMVEAPTAVPFAFALGLLSAATRGAWSVRISDTWNAGPLSLYTLAMASSGERKTPALAPLQSAVMDAESARRLEVENRNRERAVYRRRAEAALKDAQKGDDPMAEVNAVLEVERFQPLPEPALFLSDTTTEALGVHLTEQRGPAALLMTEGTLYATVGGAYAEGSANVGLFNCGYDGERYTDRRIRRDGIDIAHPFLAIAAAVQPEVMTGYANRDTEGSGFLGRHLFVVPDSLVGTRTFDGPPIPEVVQKAWDQAVKRVADKAWDHHLARLDDPATAHYIDLRLSGDAAALLVGYARALEARKVDGSEVHGLGGWAEKHPARVARVAALFALLESVEATTVEATHVEAALSLADQMVDHAVAAFTLLRNVSRRGPLQRVLRAVMGHDTVSTREVYRRVRGQAWASVESVRSVLSDLADLGWVRPAPSESKTGRPSERWEVYPSLAQCESEAGLLAVLAMLAVCVEDGSKPPSLSLSEPSSSDTGDGQKGQNPVALTVVDAPPRRRAKPRVAQREPSTLLDRLKEAGK